LKVSGLSSPKKIGLFKLYTKTAICQRYSSALLDEKTEFVILLVVVRIAVILSMNTDHWKFH
jgi:hypothetical protein